MFTTYTPKFVSGAHLAKARKTAKDETWNITDCKAGPQTETKNPGI